MRVLAIDPGFDRMGIALLEGDPSNPTVLISDTVMPPKGTKEARLAHIEKAVDEALVRHTPDILALEKLFFSTNRKTALGVAEARGAVLARAGAHAIRVVEYAPQHVKLAVTGYGNADKKAVIGMVERLVKLPPKKRFDDEIDAIALGIAALAQGYPQH